MRRSLVWGLSSVGLVAAVFVFAFFRAGIFLDAPSQQPERADLIVTLGGDVGARVHKAAELYRQGFAPTILLTGLEGGHAGTRSHYLNWRARLLVDRKVPASALLFDEVSANTWEEAVNTLSLMQARKMQSVLVVSDPPHLRRLDRVWGKVFAGSGIQFRLVAAPMEKWDAAHWWSNEASAQYVVNEYIKLGYYWLAH
jgi:uncharacterized SAM-binding protein YcdF (DUF218 family)